MRPKNCHIEMQYDKKKGDPLDFLTTPSPGIFHFASNFLLDDSASQSGARASGLEAVRTSAKSEVIDLLVNDDGPAVDAPLAFRIQRDFVVEDAHQGWMAVDGGLDVAEVPEMSYCRRFAAVRSLKFRVG